MNAGQFQRIAKALADPRRFEIFEQMAAADGELCCGEIVNRFPVAQATVSHHLKELTDAGLVEIRPEGQFRYFRARREVLADYIDELQRRAGMRAVASGSKAPQTKARVASKSKRRAAVRS